MLQQFIERDKFVEQARENRARQAFSWGRYESVGWGEWSYPDVLEFGVTFVREPIVTYGYSVEDSESLDRLPMSTGGVFRWRQNDKGYYTGAHVFVVVDQFVQPSDNPDYASQLPLVVHSFMFTETAIKDIDVDPTWDE